MTREELKERVSLENVERSLQFTNIPSHQLYQKRNKHKDHGKERNQKADHRRNPCRSRSGGSGPGTSQGRHQPVPLYRVTGTRLSESKQIFKLRASLVFMTRG